MYEATMVEGLYWARAYRPMYASGLGGVSACVWGLGCGPAGNTAAPRPHRVVVPTISVTLSPMVGWTVSVLAVKPAMTPAPSMNLKDGGAVPSARAATAAPASVSAPIHAALIRAILKADCTVLQLLRPLRMTAPDDGAHDESHPRLPIRLGR